MKLPPIEKIDRYRIYTSDGAWFSSSEYDVEEIKGDWLIIQLKEIKPTTFLTPPSKVYINIHHITAIDCYT